MAYHTYIRVQNDLINLVTMYTLRSTYIFKIILQCFFMCSFELLWIIYSIHIVLQVDEETMIFLYIGYLNFTPFHNSLLLFSVQYTQWR